MQKSLNLLCVNQINIIIKFVLRYPIFFLLIPMAVFLPAEINSKSRNLKYIIFPIASKPRLMIFATTSPSATTMALQTLSQSFRFLPKYRNDILENHLRKQQYCNHGDSLVQNPLVIKCTILLMLCFGNQQKSKTRKHFCGEGGEARRRGGEEGTDKGKPVCEN